MSKLAQATSKYTIYAKFEADGTVEKPDVIGAVFGQTEGLLGPDMELRELQKTGRIGRIDVDMKTIGGKSSGMIIIPSSLDSSETALVAACVETIERVGPCLAKIGVEKIEDTRITKRQYVVERAKELLSKMFQEDTLDSQQITEQIKEAVRTKEISEYKGMPAGPGIQNYDEVIIVEGRADVLLLLRNGIKNVVAIEGTSVPPAIASLAREKITTAFLDGDRGGDLILKELQAVAEIDFVARAPRGKEVEELQKKEIFKALREKVPTDQAKTEAKNGEIRQSAESRTQERTEFRQDRPEYKSIERSEYKPVERSEFKPAERTEFKQMTGAKIDADKMNAFKSVLNELVGTRAACFLDENKDILGRVPVKEMFTAMRELKAESLVFDGDIDQKLVNQCLQNGIKYIVGMKVDRIRNPEGLTILTIHDLK
jgi:DNA primase